MFTVNHWFNDSFSICKDITQFKIFSATKNSLLLCVKILCYLVLRQIVNPTGFWIQNQLENLAGKNNLLVLIRNVSFSLHRQNKKVFIQSRKLAKKSIFTFLKMIFVKKLSLRHYFKKSYGNRKSEEKTSSSHDFNNLFIINIYIFKIDFFLLWASRIQRIHICLPLYGISTSGCFCC